jgi:hypothetical protein
MVDVATAVKQAVSRHEDGYVAMGRPVVVGMTCWHRIFSSHQSVSSHVLF